MTIEPSYVDELKNNKYVSNATINRITYTDEFKYILLEGVAKGKTAKQIFKECGLDIDKIGEKRVYKCIENWKESYNKNMASFSSKSHNIDDEIEYERKINSLNDKVEKLTAENEKLSNMLKAAIKDVKKLNTEINRLRGTSGYDYRKS